MINILFTIIIYTLINVIAITLGWILTETKFRIAELHPILNRKPFSCKPCMTFHLIWIFQSLIAYLIGSWLWFILGIITAFVIFYNLYLEDKKSVDNNNNSSSFNNDYNNTNYQ